MGMSYKDWVLRASDYNYKDGKVIWDAALKYGVQKPIMESPNLSQDKEIMFKIINRLQHLAIEKGLNCGNCKDIAEVYENYFESIEKSLTNVEHGKPAMPVLSG